MTRRAATGIACVMAVMVGLMAAGLADQATNQPTPRPASASPDVGDYWAQQLQDAQVALEANTTALHAAPITGQPIDRLTRQCHTAVGHYNQAAAHLNLALINPSKECTP